MRVRATHDVATDTISRSLFLNVSPSSTFRRSSSSTGTVQVCKRRSWQKKVRCCPWKIVLVGNKRKETPTYVCLRIFDVFFWWIRTPFTDSIVRASCRLGVGTVRGNRTETYVSFILTKCVPTLFRVSSLPCVPNRWIGGRNMNVCATSLLDVGGAIFIFLIGQECAVSKV